MGTTIQEQYRELHPLERNYECSPEEKELVAYVGRHVDLCDSHKLPDMREYAENVRFYVGEQWDQEFGRRKSRAGEEGSITNWFQQVIDDLCARQTENRPYVAVLPATDNEDDRQNARACEKLVYYDWRQTGMPIQAVEFVKLAHLGGTSWLKTSWDPNAGDLYFPAEDDERTADIARELGGPHEGFTDPQSPERATSTGPGAQPRQRRTGAVVIDVLSVTEVGYDPGAARVRDMRWMYHRRPMHLDQIYDLWPDRGMYVRPDADTTTSGTANIRSGGYDHAGSNAEMYQDHAWVTEYWERPSRRHPGGLYAVVCGGMLMQPLKDLPYGEFPFEPLRSKTLPRRFAGQAWASVLRDPQHEYNHRDREIKKQADRLAVPHFLAAAGSILSYPDDEAGSEILYDPSLPPPKLLNAPPISDALFRLKQEARDVLYDLAGLSEIDRGAIPAGLSGRAIGMAADLQATRLGPMVREMESAFQGAMRRGLRYRHDNMPIAQTLQIIGRDGLAEVVHFHRSQITSTDVILQENSMLPRHKSYRNEQILMAHDRGVFGDPTSPETQRETRKRMEFGDWGEMEGDRGMDRRYAAEVNLMLAAGQYVHPNPWAADLEVQYDERLDYMSTADYRMLPPETQQLFERNLAHTAYLMGQLQQGVEWWSFLEDPNGDLPPVSTPPSSEVQPEAPQGPAPWAPAPPAPMDAFGMAPEDQAAMMDPALLAQQIAAQMPAPQMPAPMYDPALNIPESTANVSGPGVADYGAP
jgi:hypothetical protein